MEEENIDISICYATSCENFEILHKRIPDLAKEFK